MTDSLLAEQEVQQTTEDSLLPDPPMQPSVGVLKNDQEAAAVLATAMGEVDFSTSYRATLSAVQAGNHLPVLSNILLKEKEDNILAARATALAFARARDAANLEATAKQLRDLESSQPNANDNPSSALHAATVRAIESTGLEEAARRRRDFNAINKATEGAAASFVTRALISQAASQAEEKATNWDKVKSFFTDFLSFGANYFDNALLNKHFGEKIGEKRYINTFAAAQDIKDFMMNLPPTEQKKLLEAVVADENMNPARKADLLRRMAEMTKEEFVADSAFRVLDATLVTDAIRIVTGLARKGTPGKVLKEAAGEETAGKAVAEDLLNRTNITGWTNEELFARAIAAGRMPFDADPAAAVGLNATTQRELRTRYNELLDSINARLNSSGMTKEEIAKAADDIRNSYLQATDPSLYHVNFGEASVDGMRVTLYKQDASGRVFLSKEAAEAAAHADGLVNFKIVPVNAVDDAAGTTRAQIVHHGGSVTTKFDPGFIKSGEGGDSLGHGFYVSSEEALAENFAKNFGGRLTKWDVPENDKFTHWHEGWGEQPALVQKAYTKLLKQSPDELSEMTGQDLYIALRDKLGSSQKASAALRKEGVVGNYATKSGAHGYGPQHLLFDAKDAKFKGLREVEPNAPIERVEEEPIEIDGETFYSKATSVPRNTPPTPRNPSRWDKGEPLFADGRETEWSGTIGSRVGSVADGWKKLLGITGKLVVISVDDLPQLTSRLPIKLAPGSLQHMTTFTQAANASYSPFRVKGQLYHVITMNPKMTGSNFNNVVTTLAHEMGHAFDVSVLQTAAPATRMALQKEFARWYEARRKGKAGDFFTEFHAPSEDNVNAAVAWHNSGDPFRNAGTAKELAWYADFEEWWAEHFARFMLTDAKPRGVVEQFFADAVRKLQEFYRNVVSVLGDKAVSPNENVRRFLQEHIEGVRKTESTLDMMLEYLGFSRAAQSPPTLLGGSGRNTPDKKDVGVLLGARAASEEPPTGWLIQLDRVDPYSYYAVGKFSEKDIESMPWLAIDPKHAASEQAVEARVVGVHGEAKVRKDFSDFIMPYYQKLSRAGVQRVEALLKEGDSFSNAGGKGREFTATEAMAKGLSHDEAAAYLATRQLRMAMYHVRNGELVRHMRAQGLREVELVGTGIRTAGSELSVDMAVGTLTDKMVYDYLNLANKKVSGDGIRELYAQGKRIVRLAEPIKIEGEMRRHLVVDDSTAKVRDIHTALSYRPGEYARIYSDEYFIRRTVTRVIDGERVPHTEVVRTAASVREAKEFVDGVKEGVEVLKNGGGDPALQKAVGRFFDPEEFKRAYADGEFDEMSDLSYHYTRNQEEYLNGSVQEALAYGRTFYSQRQEKVMGMNPLKENTLGVFESLEREITNVSRVANITQWREQMVRRWMNTFGDMIPNRTGDDVADFFSAADATFTQGGKEAQFAQRTHRYIMRQIGLRTQEERLYEQVTRQMTEKWFTGNEKIETVGAAIRQSSLLGFIRNINFNLNLGMFNPAQLIVQANGAATALILSPMHGAVAAKTFPLLRMALMSDNPDVWKFFGKVDATLFGNSEEFVKLVKAVRQTGIVNNMRSTSLYNLEDGRLNIFGGYPQRVLGGHAFFFNRGEEFSRLVSFDVARREWMAANKGADWTTKEALAEILVRQDDLTQNMTRANLARFQEGAMSIPLQFAQYNIKLAANVMSAVLGKGEGRGFTKMEALALVGGHIILYGAAGNGLMSLVDEMLDPETKESMSVEAKTYMAQGLLSGLLNQLGEWFTGEKMNVALGSRLGAFDYYQKLADAVFNDPKNVYEALLGPTVGTAKRLSVIHDVANLWATDPELTGQDVMEGLARMTSEQVAVLRNAAKAYLFHMHQGKMLDKNGVGIAQLSPNEVLAQAVGFQPTAAVDVHRLIQSKKSHNEALDDIAKLIMQVQRDIMTARLRGDHKYADEQHKLLTALWPQNAGDVQDVRRRIRDRLYPYDSEFQKLLGEYMWKGQTYERPLVTTQEPRNVK